MKKKLRTQTLQSIVSSSRLRPEFFEREAEALLAVDPGNCGHCHAEVLVRAAKRRLDDAAEALVGKRRLSGNAGALARESAEREKGLRFEGQGFLPALLLHCPPGRHFPTYEVSQAPRSGRRKRQ